MSIYEKLGIKPGSHNPNSKVAQALKRKGVMDSPEFKRIKALPRRLFDEKLYPDASAVYSLGPCGDLSCSICKGVNNPALRMIQSAILIDASQNNGLFASVGVGGGKTLASLLLHDAMNAHRTCLLVPPNLRDKTLQFDVPDYKKHFKIGNVFGLEDVGSGKEGIYVIAYSEISSKEESDFFDRLRPDLVIADEAHNLRNKAAARTRRFLRFMRKFPCKFVAMSGSIATRSILDFAHLIELALGANSPLPNDFPTLREWADALDCEEGKMNGEQFGKTEPGVLTEFCEEGESIRDGYRRRMVDSPGVISTTESACGANLWIRTVKLRPPQSVIDSLAKLESTWAWDGEEFDKAIDLARYQKCLTQGFFYRLKWPNGEKDLEWLEAKNGWAKAIRYRLNHTNKEGQDSPALLEAMAERGEWTPDEWWAWVAQRSKPEPQREPVEISRWIVDQAWAWAEKSPGLIWVDSPVVGQWLAEKGIIYFGEGTDRELLEFARMRNAGEFTIALSWHAHGTGKNLQAWHRNLITYPPGNGSAWEQIIGRSHRPGQNADDVYVDVLIVSSSAQRAWEQSLSDAAFFAEISGASLKLNIANVAEDSELI